MRHISTFDNGTVYEITESVNLDRKACDDIKLIWRYAPGGFEAICDKSDVKPLEFVNFYYGEYDYNTTEEYIEDYWKAKIEAHATKPKAQPRQTLQLPIAYVNIISSCLEAIKVHKLMKLVYDVDYREAENVYVDLEAVLSEICGPLQDIDKDTEIILK